MTVVSLPRVFSQVREVALQRCTTLTLGELMRKTSSDPAAMLAAAQWVQNQVPIRVARRLDDFLQLPYVVVSNPSISRVLGIYLDTFETLMRPHELSTSADEADFCHIIRDQLHKHHPVAQLIAEGYREVRSTYPAIRLDGFLNDFFVARIALRIVFENYVDMRHPQPSCVGVVKQGMNPLDVIEDVGHQICELTRSLYGASPELEFRGNRDCQLDYIPRHISYMVRELLKNAFRSTVERHLRAGGGGSDVKLPPVTVELQQGDVHVIIKISDQGGGMPKWIQKQAWQYGWTTVRHGNGDEVSQADGDRPQVVRSAELAGFGFGLPLTRLHAQYFGGDVFMQALPGHGTDMYLLLTHLKEGTPSTEIEDLSTVLYEKENSSAPGSLRMLRSGQKEMRLGSVTAAD